MLLLGFVLGALTALACVCAVAAWIVKDITE